MQNGCLEESYHVNMIINLLMHFPEIYTVSYNLSDSTCSLFFMYRGRVTGEQYDSLRQKLDENLETFRFFKKKEHIPISLNKKYYRGFTQLEARIKDNYLTEEEIGLITRVIRDIVGKFLISDLRQEEVESFDSCLGGWEEVFSALPSRGAESSVQKLIAFRESGKVYVFNQ